MFYIKAKMMVSIRSMEKFFLAVSKFKSETINTEELADPNDDNNIKYWQWHIWGDFLAL